MAEARTGSTVSGNGTQPRTPQQIEAELARTRESLAGTMDAIVDRVTPQNVARRLGDRVKAQFVDGAGRIRAERVAAVAGVVGLFAGLAIWRRIRS
jgi:Protein of unknown function (DUF3618)